MLRYDVQAPYATGHAAQEYRFTPAPMSRRVNGGQFQEVGITNPHRPPINTTIRPLETSVSLYAPYGSRLKESLFFEPNHTKPQSAMPQYNSLSDPLLAEYYARKFSKVPRPPSSSRRGRSSTDVHGKLRGRVGVHGRAGIDKSSMCIYKVSVTTGTKKGSATDAKVYVKINGSKGKLPKKQLTKKAGSVKKKKARFRFAPGSTHVFKFDGKDIGEIKNVVVEHDGLTKEEGWYLEQVEIIKKNLRTGKEQCYMFLCQQWLSLHHGDCQLSRQLYAKSYTKTEYEVVVVTGNMKGGGTDANIFLTLFGKTGQTPKLQLKSNSKDSFERNQSDIFVLKTQCVGPMDKIRIQHDNQGFGPGWFLDRVVVTDLKNPKWKYYFPCGQWLAKDEGDRLICRDLLGSRDPLAVRKMSQYKVTAYTGDKRGAGTDANVYITLFSDAGDTGERFLKSKKNNFERNQVDEFMLECPNMGTIKRLRIGHDNSGLGPGWFLDKVIVDDIEQNRVYEFPCQRWFSKDEDDGQISRDLLPNIGVDQAPPGVPYHIEMMTGDTDRAGTSARVFITLYGGKGGDQSSGSIWLENGNFKRGRTDIFKIDVAENLSPLSRIEVGHDDSGAGPGWFLDRVMVDCPSAGIEQWFVCDKWLATDEGDGLIQRTLKEDRARRKTRKKLVTWFVRTYTSDMRGAGTDANVHLVAYGKTKDGEYRKSDDIPLDNKGDNFESGQTDQFKIEMIEIGRPYKLRVGHDNTGSFAGWHLNKVEMENMLTKKRYVFTCNRWLALDEDDGSIIREMPAEGEDIKKPQPLNQYIIQVFTGNKRGAGTDANVFCNIFGEQGDTGERPLTHSKSHRNKFERSNCDEFIIDAVNLKKLKKIRIGHDGSRPGSGWFLDKVIVKPTDNSAEEQVFECNRWLDVDEDDGAIVREITAGGSQMLSTTSYHVSVKTGDCIGAGTDANVFIKIFGSKADTGQLQMKSADNTRNKFERGRTDLFKMEASDIGKIEKVRIGHDGASPGSGWFLDEVRVDVPSKGEGYTFACHRWLDTSEEDGLLEVELEPTQIDKGDAKIPYEVTVWTGDVRGGGTDSNVFLQMYGEYGKTEQTFIRNKTDNFEQGQQDKFKLELADIGPLLKIRVGHDGKGMFSGWFLDKILIQRHPIKGSKRRRKVGKQASFKKIGRSLVESDSEEEKRRSRSQGDGLRRKYGSQADLDDPRKKKRPQSANFRRGGKRYTDDEESDYERDNPRRRPSSRQSGRTSRQNNLTDSEDERYKRRKSKAGRSRYGSDESLPGSRSRRKSGVQRRKDSYDSDYGSPRNNRRKKSTHRRDESDDSDYGSPRTNRRKSTMKRHDYDSDNDLKKRKKSNAKKRYSDSEDERRDSPDRRNDYDLKKRKKSNAKKRYSDSEDERRDSPDRRKKSYSRKFDDERSPVRGDDDEEGTEDYWFVCNRWFAKGEDDNKIVRELLPTDEQGNALKTGLQELEYKVTVFTGDVSGAGTDSNVFINISGEYGDTGERQLKDSQNHRNKFETNQEDVFLVKAVELGRLKKVKIRHDNKGFGAAWFLGHVEIEDPKTREQYFFPCQRWLATKEDDGQIARELVPVDASLKRRLSSKSPRGVRDEVALETKAALTTYHVYVYTGDKFGAGTDANVFAILYGDSDDTGPMSLKTSKTNRNKFERNQMDEFVIEAVDIGELRKLRIGHDNAGGGGAWFLERVEIDCPSLGKKWYFQSGRWLAKNKDDGKLEVDLSPQEMATEDYTKCIPYEITTHTTDKSGASTDADVYIELYGTYVSTGKKSLCSSKKERKSSFKRGAVDKFVIELEDIGQSIEKIRIGHDNSGFASGWHLDKIEVRRLKDDGRGSETYLFSCKRWLARDEDDGAIERELVPEKILEERTRKDGSIKKKEKSVKGSLQKKNYTVNVYTGDQRGAGTDANVFLTVLGDLGDTGERKLHKSETNKNKFERAQVDRFVMEAADLGKVFRAKIRHDNSMWGADWFLDKIEVIDPVDGETFTFHCERWLAKKKDDGKIERSLYVKGYDGPMGSGSTMRSHAIGGSIGSMDSLRSTDPFSKSPRVNRRQMEDIPEGPTLSERKIETNNAAAEAIPYTVRVRTGDERDQGTDSNVWIKILGRKKKHTGRQFLELAQKRGFMAGSVETFSLEAPDVDDVKMIELGHDGVTPGSGWYVKEVEVDMPTKGKHYFFSCKAWLARDKSDGKTQRMFSLLDADQSVVSYNPLIPYEVTIHTGDVANAGCDSRIFIKVFGSTGATSDIHIDKQADRFERGHSDLIKMEIDDVGVLKKLRIGHDGRGNRPDWYLEKIEMRNMEAGKLTVFKCNDWLSKKRGDGALSRDLVAIVKGKTQLKTTNYKVSVKTSDVRGAGTNANVFIVIFGEHGDSGDKPLRQSESNGSPFENNQTDVFTFNDELSLGALMKVRVWHDNKGLGSAWHLAHIEVEDLNTGTKFMFPCNRWLSRSEDDKQICRELSCANLPAPSPGDKIKYEIEVMTSDKKDAGMMHHAWLVMEGSNRSSKEFIMENSSRNKILRRGSVDNFIMSSRNLGSIERVLLGAIEREDKPLGHGEGREGMWHCHQVAIKNKSTGDRYIFPCKSWVPILPTISRKHSKVLEIREVEESKLTTVRNLGTVKYEIAVTTGDVKHAGTDANVSIIIYGTNGDTGKRPLVQKFRDLFERGRTDTFQIESMDQGDLKKIYIEHDNKGFGAGWFLETVEVTNMASNRKWKFPCGQWLDKKQGDGEISREILARD